MNKNIIAILGIVIIAIIGLITYTRLGAPVSSDESVVVCTQEAKQCPDGSYVGRTGPRCEFAPCPTIENSVPVPQPPAPLP